MSMSESSWKEFFVSAKINENASEIYAKAFVQHDIDLDMGSELTHKLLSEMGILLVGHRIKILRYFAFQSKYVSYDSGTIVNLLKLSSVIKNREIIIF